jgi:purine-binding chemotaxis protein CheW
MPGPAPRLPFATEATYHAYRRPERDIWQHEVLACSLGPEEYGVDIRRVREIIRAREATEVPRAPAFVRGVISVRGAILPVVDLRARLRLSAPAPPADRGARIVIVNRGADSFGLLVDGVRLVVRLRDSDLEAAPALFAGPAAELIAAVGRPGKDRLVILLDLDAVLGFQLGGPIGGPLSGSLGGPVGGR